MNLHINVIHWNVIKLSKFKKNQPRLSPFTNFHPNFFIGFDVLRGAPTEMSAVIGGVVGAVGAVSKLVVGLLGVSYQCGALIVAFAIAVGRQSASFISSLADLVTILYQDFGVFSLDLLSKVVDVASLCACLVSGAVATVKNVFQLVWDAVYLVVHSVTDGFSLGFNAVSQACFFF